MKHILGLVRYGMTDIGEIMDTLGFIKSPDEEGWIDAWTDRGNRLLQSAQTAEKKNKLLTASQRYLRASSYYRIGLMYFSDSKDSRMKKYALLSKDCYAKYLEYSGYPGEYVEIPYEGTSLPGHFYRSPVAKEKAPLLMIIPGRDTWAEDTVFAYDAALKRGIHCLVFDGPGQGFALRIQGLTFRPDWENVITLAVDFAQKITGVDKKRIGLMGISFGGFLAPRAVAFEKRIKLCITDPGNMDWGSSIGNAFETVGRLPKFLVP